MYFSPGEHPPPHFHVYYSGYAAIIDIITLQVTGGNLPRKQTKLVLGWAKLHQKELINNWNLVINGKSPLMIDPLQ